MNKRINEETDLCKPTFFIFSVLNSVGHPMTAILCDPSVGAQNKKSVCNTSPKIQEARKKKKSPGNSELYPAFPRKEIQAGDLDRDEEPGIKQNSDLLTQAAF